VRPINYKYLLFGIVFLKLHSNSFAKIEDNIINMFDSIHSFEYKVDTKKTFKNITIDKFDITSYSIQVNGNEHEYSKLIRLYDSTFQILLKMPIGEIVEMQFDSSKNFYKVLEIDSVLSFKFSCIAYKLNGDINLIEAKLSKINDKIKSGISWNEITYLTDSEFDNEDSINMSTGWLRETEISEKLKTEIIKHNLYEMFTYVDTKLDYGWIVYKTNNERYFERRKIIAISKQK
jgi:hypothetical protein